MIEAKAQTKIENYISSVLNINEINKEDLFTIDKSNNLKLITYDTAKINKMLQSVYNKLDYLLNRNTISFSVDIPISYLFLKTSYFLSNVTIPVTVSNVSYFAAEIVKDIKEYGINNSMLEVAIRLKISFIATVPFISKRVNTSIDIPLVLTSINGEIPSFYFK